MGGRFQISWSVGLVFLIASVSFFLQCSAPGFGRGGGFRGGGGGFRGNGFRGYGSYRGYSAIRGRGYYRGYYGYGYGYPGYYGMYYHGGYYPYGYYGSYYHRPFVWTWGGGYAITLYVILGLVLICVVLGIIAASTMNFREREYVYYHGDQWQPDYYQQQAPPPIVVYGNQESIDATPQVILVKPKEKSEQKK
ncbi:hypothetical protein M3Y94_01215300 [Aphelenchoides besseyi]|nr:hypothetical protein M3Y94_01215300 [Aphelenchoides besseyi]